ncbi:hypothetical protein AAVH_12870 [Aphelenchoides avenae]|nr:hypothetical protein AAVH_12870 [Aphelenchus avenae]
MLREAIVKFHRYADCHIANLEDNANFSDPFVQPENVICAGGKGSGAAQGDGPLMVVKKGVWYHVGVASYMNAKHPLKQDLYPCTQYGTEYGTAD